MRVKIIVDNEAEVVDNEDIGNDTDIDNLIAPCIE